MISFANCPAVSPGIGDYGQTENIIEHEALQGGECIHTIA